MTILAAKIFQPWAANTAFNYPLDAREATSRPNIVRPSFDFQRVIVSELAPIEWGDAVLARMNELCALEAGWDGYRAIPVSFQNANFALRVLERVSQPGTPTPQIIPGISGDLQIEWHENQTDIELHIVGPYRVSAWRLAPSTRPDGEELDLAQDFKIVAKWLEEMAGASGADRASAG